jgi:tetratricopeptide (TPR) repeat protein
MVADDASASAQIRPLLPGTTGSALLVTSRTQLTGLSGSSLHVLDVFTPEEATLLFTRMVGEQRVTVEPGAVRHLAQSCGFLPLAVRIAGSRLASRPTWRISVLVRRMTTERRLLDELVTEDLSVRISVALSYRALGDLAQKAFRLLGLLGPHDVAEWVIAALLGESDASAVVNELVEKSLLTPIGTDGTGQPRYQLHDLLREYAREQLAEHQKPEQDAALQRALAGWLQLAELANNAIPCDPFFPPTTHGHVPAVLSNKLAHLLVTDPLVWFSTERLTLSAAVQSASARGWHEMASQLGMAQAGFQYLQNRTDDAEQMWQTIMNATAPPGDTILNAQAALRYAAVMIGRGEAARVTELLDQCINQLADTDDGITLAFSLYWRASAAYDMGHFEAAVSYGERCIAIARHIGSRHAAFLPLRQIAQSLVSLGRITEGIEICKRAVSLAGEIGEESYVLAAQQSLGYVYVMAKAYTKAIPLCETLLRDYRRIGNVRGEGLALGLIGDAYAGLGRHRQAMQVLSEALSIFRDHNNRRFYGLCLLKLGLSHRHLGDLHLATYYLSDSLQTFQELRFLHYEQQARDELAKCRV